MSKIFQPLALLSGVLVLLAAAPAFADRTPDWMAGKYEGYNRKYHQTITVRTNREGRLIVTNLQNGREIACNAASYHRGLLNINDRDYRVSQNGDGFCMVQL